MTIIDPLQSNQIIRDKYSIANNAFRLDKIKNAELDAYKNEPKDEINVIMGDDKQPDTFYPQVKLCRWSNETNFSVRLKHDKKGNEKVETIGDKIKWSKGNIEVEFYDYTENEGGYKFVPYLKKKPLTNKLIFTVQRKGLNFCKQPPLTQEFQNGYSEEFKREIIVTETQVKDLDGNVLINRPVEIVNSYVVYHSSKGGMVDKFGKAYGTGQAFVDYRPHFFDANGLEAWGDIDYVWNGDTGERIVTIPQDFLDISVYPIKSNDTFGYTTVGGTSGTFTAGTARGGEDSASPSSNGTLNSVELYTDTTAANENIKGSLYLTDGTLVAANNIGIKGSGVAAWQSIPMGSENIYSASVYYSFSKEFGTTNHWYNSGTTNAKFFTNAFATDFPTPATFSNGSARKYSIYATYTAGGGGTVQPNHLMSLMGCGN
jgi:hypothetical protein